MKSRVENFLVSMFSVIRILVVDDEQKFLNKVVFILENMGFKNIETSLDANSALIKMKFQRYDLVITDFAMPNGMNGVELIENIQKQDAKQSCMILTRFKSLEVVKDIFHGNEFVYLVSKEDMESEKVISFKVTMKLIATDIILAEIPDLQDHSGY